FRSSRGARSERYWHVQRNPVTRLLPPKASRRSRGPRSGSGRGRSRASAVQTSRGLDTILACFAPRRVTMCAMRTLALLMLAPAALSTADNDGWISMFDGKTLDGWKANERPESWTVKDGCITGDGEASHLFWMQRECENCEFKAEVKISKGGNSGMYF